MTEAALKREDVEIVAGIDPYAQWAAGYPIYTILHDCLEDADVVVDYSNPAALPDVLSFSKEKRLPAIIATTGYSAEETASIYEAANTQPIFFTGNLSLGINLMQELCRMAARVLGGQFDIEITEKHHNLKIDSPSGTSLMLADTIASELPTQPHYEYERHTKRELRSRSEIGIHSIRGGTIVGEHEVLFAGPDETITISHSAGSKLLFASGALNASIFMRGKPPGMYTMKDLIT
jgi:4-hydroxy-tetrahydrodipicolinate reductase